MSQASGAHERGSQRDAAAGLLALSGRTVIVAAWHQQPVTALHLVGSCSSPKGKWGRLLIGVCHACSGVALPYCCMEEGLQTKSDEFGTVEASLYEQDGL